MDDDDDDDGDETGAADGGTGDGGDTSGSMNKRGDDRNVDSEQGRTAGGPREDEDNTMNDTNEGGGKDQLFGRTMIKSGSITFSSSRGNNAGTNKNSSSRPRPRLLRKGVILRAWITTLTVAMGPFGTLTKVTPSSAGFLLCLRVQPAPCLASWRV